MKLIKIEDHQIQITKELYTLLNASTCKEENRAYISKPFYVKSLNKICAASGNILTLTEELTKPLPPETLYFNLHKEKKYFYLIPIKFPETPPNIEKILPDLKTLIPYKNGDLLTIPKDKTSFAFLIFDLFKFLEFPINLEFLNLIKGKEEFKLSHNDYKVQLDFASGVLFLMTGIKINKES